MVFIDEIGLFYKPEIFKIVLPENIMVVTLTLKLTNLQGREGQLKKSKILICSIFFDYFRFLSSNNCENN